MIRFTARPFRQRYVRGMSVPSLVGTPDLLERLRTFFFPGGERAANTIQAIRTAQKGEMRMSPGARWIPFTAKEFMDATCSRFRWEARLDPGKVTAPTVIDAYERGHGVVQIKLGGVLPVKKITGPDADRGELQRYLGSMMFCPPMLLNHTGLEWTHAGPLRLRVRDRNDPTGATVYFDLSEDGQPLACHAVRPRLVGKDAVMTPWSGKGSQFREYEGLRVATHLEVSWQLPEGEFAYFREDLIEFMAVR